MLVVYVALDLLYSHKLLVCLYLDILSICDGTITYIPNTWDNKLLYYVAFALDHCPDSASINVEEIRDQIRGDIAAILPEYKPRYRSYPEF